MTPQREVAPEAGARASGLGHAAAHAAAHAAVDAAVALLPRGRWLLAVSGGRDSMVLLDAMASARSREIAAVATFDHATGPGARRAAALVEREAEARGIRVVSARAAAGGAAREAAWRDARHAFLEAWAKALGAQVVTAHTRDDQVETVVQRLLRAAGPRGLAGMLAGGVRPLLDVPRATIIAYARARGVPFLEDPSNASLIHQRNRVRLELLPALERAHPGFGAWCWALGQRASRWRAEVEALVDSLGTRSPTAGSLALPTASVASLTAGEWEVLWPALAARAGVVMDRRGVERASAWAPTARPGSSVPLAGGARIERTRTTFVIRGNARTP